jgi:predicted metal-dependent phosphotriesterase family hydrolase
MTGQAGSTPSRGAVITVRGDVEPGALGAVLMHEHLYFSCQDWDEGPTPPERVALLMDYAVPNLRRLHEHGCHTLVDATPVAWRAWPDTYVQVAEAADLHVVLATGFYREMEVGSYWVEEERQAIWPAVRERPVAELAELCVREITEGIHGTGVRAGIIKLGSSGAELTAAEAKAFRAGAMAQLATGVAVTTHCTAPGAHATQLEALTEAGVDASRVVIGHTARHVVNETGSVREWMARGATFLATNLRMDEDWEFWAEFVRVVRGLFDEGLGEHLVLGLDWAFETEQGPFLPCTFMPPPPFRYMFTHTLPRFRKLGLEEAAIEQMLVANAARLLAAG